MTQFKIFGMQRTGTTFTMETMNLNLEDSIVHNNEFGHKHSKPLTQEEMLLWIIFESDKTHRKEWDEIYDKKTLIPVVVIKNPYSWFNSIESWGKIAWAPGYSTKKAYSDWNRKYEWWKDLLENPRAPFCKGMMVHYEDLILDTPRMLRFLGSTFSVEVAHMIRTPQKVDQSAPFTKARRDYYLGDDFGLTAYQRHLVTDLVDWDLMGYYGYTRRP